jgi:MoaA/NifB/PqqE/SkfB family radical SAM enzyme
MNKYINLNRIEFVITKACSGKCKHCSWGELPDKSENINADAAVYAVKKLSERYKIESLMTFGGEPLLFADSVCKIHSVARDCGIPRRDIITNGFFTKDEHKIYEVAKNICASGVNSVLLSVDAFHQEFIPFEAVETFAEALISHGIPSLQVHPAWVVNEENENMYNTETRRLLNIFTRKGIPATRGNNIFPSGNAAKHLTEYYPPPKEVDLSAPCGSMPYTSRIDDVSSLGINPNGDVNLCSITIGNIYSADILNIVDTYDPYGNPLWHSVLNGGVTELLRYAHSHGVTVDINDCVSTCDACRKIMAAFA